MTIPTLKILKIHFNMLNVGIDLKYFRWKFNNILNTKQGNKVLALSGIVEQCSVKPMESKSFTTKDLSQTSKRLIR